MNLSIELDEIKREVNRIKAPATYNTADYEYAVDEVFKLNLKWVQSQINTFYLTGSRYFNPWASKYSDWDYFALYTPGLEQDLISKGFKLIIASHYSDKNICKVYRYSKDMNVSAQIDVQLVEDLEAKIYCQAIMYQYINTLQPNKQQAQALWDMVLQAYYMGANNNV
jgi:hypothetical protein